MFTNPPAVDQQLLLTTGTPDAAPAPSGQLEALATTLVLLNQILSAELVGQLRHRRHHFMALDISPRYIGAEFLDRASCDQHHVDSLIARILELGGIPDLTPAALQHCLHTQRIEDTTLHSLVAEDLVAQNQVLIHYRSLIKHLGNQDPVTRRVLAVIMALEQQHRGEFARKILAQSVSGHSQPDREATLFIPTG